MREGKDSLGVLDRVFNPEPTTFGRHTVNWLRKAQS